MTQATHADLENPFRPGAGHMPPYLAGRETEKREFEKLLDQNVILENLVLSGLRGVGKTVLLETLKPIAIQKNWLWVGADLSESTSISEATMTIRLLTDLSVVTASIATGQTTKITGLRPETASAKTLDYPTLYQIWEATPGLAADKLKAVLELVWAFLQPLGKRGIVFAYDEAQNLSDHAEKNEYPLSLLLDVFQSIQRKGIRFMLVMAGLPTLFPKLVEARTFAERMFHVVFLDKLSREATEAAINVPILEKKYPVHFNPESIDTIYFLTLGYPYFIQFVCRETFDVWTSNLVAGEAIRAIPSTEIMHKLDNDFFVGRWARATDRQRDIMGVIAQLDTCTSEFTVQEVAEKSAEVLDKAFSPSHTNQMLTSLCNSGLVYRNRWGKYSLAVPLLDRFIRRQLGVPEDEAA
jgi:type II secretory pathway predicted ATPase ExeA